MRFSEFLKNYRVDKNISRERLARKLGVTHQTIYNWENEKTIPNLATVQGVRKLLEADSN